MNKKNKYFQLNCLTEVFSNKYEFAILTFTIYFLGILFQVLKLIGGFTTTPKLGNLMFFSFSNSINDFCILFGVSFIFFFLSFTTTGIINLLLNSLNITGNKIIRSILLFGSIIVILFIGDKAGWELLEIKKAIFLITPYILSIILVWYLLIKKRLNKTIFYIFLGGYLVYGFVMLLYYSDSYFGCNQLNCNDEKKNCILLKYKNDKYGFTGNGDVYKLEVFTSFYTIDYFKDNIQTGTESCDKN